MNRGANGERRNRVRRATNIAEADLRRHIGLRSAIALVIANIIGAGIFTTTGFQASALGHPGYIFLLWVVGGLLAFCGALCYGELGAAMPEAGAEYVYLRETYGAIFGFMSAFVSLIAGFSAPVASATKGLVHYLTPFFPALGGSIPLLGSMGAGDFTAIVVVWSLTGIHLLGARGGVGFNDLVTLFKVCGIAAILIAAAAIGHGDVSNLSHVSDSFQTLDSNKRLAAFGTSLIFVMFCYSGWNAAAYVASEMKAPQRDLPRALLAGTGVVLVLYLALNAVYFYGAPVEALAGKVEVAEIAARRLFGDWGATLVTAVVSVSLLASASAMILAGPRVSYALGRDVKALGFLSRVSPMTGAPAPALILQAVVTSIIILSGRVDQIQQYAGFTLVLFGSLAVSCVLVLRRRAPNLKRPFLAWGYPITPLLFLAVSLWMMFWALQGDYRLQSLLALATVVVGGCAFYLLKPRG